MATKRRRGPVDQPGLDVLGPLQDIIRQLREGKLTPEQMQAFTKHKNPFDAAEAKAADPRGQPSGMISDLHKVTIDRGRSWQERVAGMNIRFVSSQFTSDRFPMPSGESLERELGLLDMGRVRVFTFMGRVFTFMEAAVEADKLGLEIAETEDGVAYVTAHPDLQRKNPIIICSRARDSDGVMVVPVFYCRDGERSLSLDGCHDQWVDRFRVLVRRKSAAKAAV